MCVVSCVPFYLGSLGHFERCERKKEEVSKITVVLPYLKTAVRALVFLTGRLFPGSTAFLGWGSAFAWGCSVSGRFTAKHIQMCFSLPLVLLEVRSLHWKVGLISSQNWINYFAIYARLFYNTTWSLRRGEILPKLEFFP